MSFINKLEKNIENSSNISITENGAIGLKSTNKALLDMNFKISSYRNKSTGEIVGDFLYAYEENKVNAILWLFYIRDVRDGIGERRLFRICFKALCFKDKEIAIKLLPLLPEYGRWDDVWLSTFGTPVEQSAFELIKDQLFNDLANSKKETLQVSLLAKWLPSERTSSKNSRELARKIAAGINLPINKYNRILSELRKHLNIVEQKMSANEWHDIDYSTVPSKSNLIYSSCFSKHDKERRKEYLDSLKTGQTKINAKMLYPYEIINKYNHYMFDETLEQLWMNLKDIGEMNNVLTVADGSGSMKCRINNGCSATAWDVAHSLAIYSSEYLTGEFKNKYVTFSGHPEFVDLSKSVTLKGKIQIAERHSEIANTNIKAVFDMVLKTAVQNNMKQSDIPNTILILSDMEFDGCVRIDENYYSAEKPDQKFFDTIKSEYENAGYKLPRLVFWNITSRTNTIPVKENDLGVALVSGFSTNTFKMVTSGKLDPFECLLEQLYTDRYKPVFDLIKE